MRSYACPPSENRLPLYDYQCKHCQHVAEVRHGFSEVYAEACAACGGEMTRVFNPAGIVFKGSGFYITDSRKGGAEGASTSTPSAATPPASSKSDAA